MPGDSNPMISNNTVKKYYQTNSIILEKDKYQDVTDSLRLITLYEYDCYSNINNHFL